MGMPVYVDRPRRPAGPGGGRGDVRLAALGGRDVLDLQAGQRDHAGSAAASSRLADAHSHVRVCPRAVATRSGPRPTATSTRAPAAGSTRPGSSRAGRWTRRRRSSKQAGCANFAVNAGGDIRLRGAALPDDRWSVGIQHPRERDRVAAVVEGTDLAVATSGAYARGDHVLDPHTAPAAARDPVGHDHGARSRDRRRVRDGRIRNGARGRRRGRHSLPGYEAMTILENEQVLTTSGFPSA